MKISPIANKNKKERKNFPLDSHFSELLVFSSIYFLVLDIHAFIQNVLIFECSFPSNWLSLLCPFDVHSIVGKCSKNAWKMFGKCLENMWKVSPLISIPRYSEKTWMATKKSKHQILSKVFLFSEDFFFLTKSLDNLLESSMWMFIYFSTFVLNCN